MKILLSLFILCLSSAFANYVGNLAEPALINKGFVQGGGSAFKLNTGYLFDVANDKKLAGKDVDSSFGNNTRVNDFEVISNMGFGSLSLFNRIELYGRVGQSSAKLTWLASEPNTQFPNGKLLNIETENRFSWSAGAKAILFKAGNICIGVDGNYFRIPKVKRSLFFLNREAIPFSSDRQYFTLKEWHIAAGLSTRIAQIFSPYIGGKFSMRKVHFQSSNDPTSIRLKSRLPLGLFTGVSMTLSNILYINAEARFYDEQAYSVSGSASF